MAIVITVLAYFCVLLLFSHLTARKMASNETFYRANRRSPWYMVAFGMVGASISGITFVSVPGMVMRTDMTYLQMCIGFILGYFLVAFLLLPIYHARRINRLESNDEEHEDESHQQMHTLAELHILFPAQYIHTETRSNGGQC
jgi:Na+/proline symporter